MDPRFTHRKTTTTTTTNWISSLFLHNKLIQILAALNRHVLFRFHGSEIWEWLSLMILAQGISWCCSQDVSPSFSHLKVQQEWDPLPKSLGGCCQALVCQWLLARNLVPLQGIFIAFMNVLMIWQLTCPRMSGPKKKKSPSWKVQRFITYYQKCHTITSATYWISLLVTLYHLWHNERGDYKRVRILGAGVIGTILENGYHTKSLKLYRKVFFWS